MVDARFLAEIDAAYPVLGYGDRATFVRDAILQLMAKHGYRLPASYKVGPPRTGKGGRPKTAGLASVQSVGKKTQKSA